MYKIKTDEFKERYVEVPVKFMLKVYLPDDEYEGQTELDPDSVYDEIDRIGRLDLGEQVLNNIQL